MLELALYSTCGMPAIVRSEYDLAWYSLALRGRLFLQSTNGKGPGPCV